MLLGAKKMSNFPVVSWIIFTISFYRQGKKWLSRCSPASQVPKHAARGQSNGRCDVNSACTVLITDEFRDVKREIKPL